MESSATAHSYAHSITASLKVNMNNSQVIFQGINIYNVNKNWPQCQLCYQLSGVFVKGLLYLRQVVIAFKWDAYLSKKDKERCIDPQQKDDKRSSSDIHTTINVVQDASRTKY